MGRYDYGNFEERAEKVSTEIVKASLSSKVCFSAHKSVVNLGEAPLSRLRLILFLKKTSAAGNFIQSSYTSVIAT